jgi:hypothetical protein
LADLASALVACKIPQLGLSLFVNIKVIPKVTLSFTPNPLSQRFLQSKKFLLNLSIKCSNSAFNAQGWRVIIVVIQVGVVKIYVAAVEALRKKERGDETQFSTKIGGKTSLGPSYFVL